MQREPRPDVSSFARDIIEVSEKHSLTPSETEITEFARIAQEAEETGRLDLAAAEELLNAVEQRGSSEISNVTSDKTDLEVQAEADQRHAEARQDVDTFEGDIQREEEALAQLEAEVISADPNTPATIESTTGEERRQTAQRLAD